MADSLTETCFLQKAGDRKRPRDAGYDAGGFGPCFAGEPPVCIAARNEAYLQCWGRAKLCIDTVVKSRNRRCFEVRPPPPRRARPRLRPRATNRMLAPLRPCGHAARPCSGRRTQPSESPTAQRGAQVRQAAPGHDGDRIIPTTA